MTYNKNIIANDYVTKFIKIIKLIKLKLKLSK